MLSSFVESALSFGLSLPPGNDEARSEDELEHIFRLAFRVTRLQRNFQLTHHSTNGDSCATKRLPTAWA